MIYCIFYFIKYNDKFIVFIYKFNMKFVIFFKEYFCRINNLYIVFCFILLVFFFCECDIFNCVVSDEV